MDAWQLQILEANYWEHFKFAKDLSFIYPPEHFKRKKLEKEINEMLCKINNIKISLETQK